MQQKNGRSVSRTFVDEVKPQTCAIGSCDRSVMRLEVIPLEMLETFIWCAEKFHGPRNRLGSNDGVDEIVDEAAQHENLRILSVLCSTYERCHGFIIGDAYKPGSVVTAFIANDDAFDVEECNLCCAVDGSKGIFRPFINQENKIAIG